jgi:hypothetical protein
MIEFDKFSKPAIGGTEIIKYELQKRLPPELLNQFQIICDRVTELKQNKNKIILGTQHCRPSRYKTFGESRLG